MRRLFLLLLPLVVADGESEGKQLLQQIKRDISLPRYGPCWKAALVEVETGCESLTDEIQHRLALYLTNCFLETAGRPTYPCAAHQIVSDCTGAMDTAAFNSYTNFFTHARSLCQFLQNQVWTEMTERTISELSQHSSDMSQLLESSAERQSEIVRLQNHTIEMQASHLSTARDLHTSLNESQEQVAGIMSAFRQATDQHRNLLLQVFDRLESLQSFVLDEFSGFYAVVLHVAAVIVSYIVTAARYTQAARLPLFLVCLLNFCLERWLARHYLDGDSPNVREAARELYDTLQLTRRFAAGIALALLTRAWLSFTDYDMENRRLLNAMQEQLQLLATRLPPVTEPEESDDDTYVPSDSDSSTSQLSICESDFSEASWMTAVTEITTDDLMTWPHSGDMLETCSEPYSLRPRRQPLTQLNDSDQVDGESAFSFARAVREAERKSRQLSRGRYVR